MAGPGGPVTRSYAELTVVRDGDGYVLGSLGSADFFAVPLIGGQVVLWLQDGAGIAECGRRAAELAGEPVDVEGFLAGLADAGLLGGGTAQPGHGDAAQPGHVGTAQPSHGTAGWKRTAGRVTFGPAALGVQGLFAAAGIVAMIVFPRARPTYTDAIAVHVPLLSIVIISVLSMVRGLAHESAHVLAAWAAGVSSRVSISRRMIVIVYQTDLTRLWSVPRRSRAVPLLAGLVFDGASTGLLVLLELTVLRAAPLLVIHLIRAAIFLSVSAIAFQFLLFMRTDVYALFVLATGCKHLWDTKGAIARNAVRRATAEDLTILNTAGRREVLWARVFLGLYAPGVLFTAWYFAAFGLPAVRKIITNALDAVLSGGLFSPLGAAGAFAFAITAASSAFILWGLAQSLTRMARQIITGPPAAG
jgi:putative peptide zinc metalloprotease protein